MLSKGLAKTAAAAPGENAGLPAVPGKNVAQVPLAAPQVPLPAAAKAPVRSQGTPAQRPFKPPKLGLPMLGTAQLGRISTR